MKDGPTETQTKDETMMIDDGGLGLGLSCKPCRVGLYWMLGGEKQEVKEATVGVEVLLTIKTSSPFPIVCLLVYNGCIMLRQFGVNYTTKKHKLSISWFSFRFYFPLLSTFSFQAILFNIEGNGKEHLFTRILVPSPIVV